MSNLYWKIKLVLKLFQAKVWKSTFLLFLYLSIIPPWFFIVLSNNIQQVMNLVWIKNENISSMQKFIEILKWIESYEEPFTKMVSCWNSKNFKNLLRRNLIRKKLSQFLCEKLSSIFDSDVLKALQNRLAINGA